MDSGDSLSTYLRILAKRWWLIAILIIVAGGTTVYRLETEPPSYAAETRLRVSAPEPEEVAIYTPLGRPDVRQEVDVVKSDFVEIASGLDTAWRTSDALNREVDGSYINRNIKVKHSPDSDFVSITARASTPELAQSLANTHTDVSLAYFGEIRAKPITGIRKFLSEEMARNATALAEANKDLQDFRNENKIGSVDEEITSYRNLVNSLRIERDTAFGRGEKETADRFDALIRNHEERLTSLIALTIDYRTLTSRVSELESTYSLLLSKETEARLKEEQARDVGFIQIVEPARTPTQPSSTSLTSYIVMSLIAAVLLGAMLSFLLEYLAASTAGRFGESRVSETEVVGARQA